MSTIIDNAASLFLPRHQTARAVDYRIGSYPIHVQLSSGEAIHCDEFTAIALRDAFTAALTARLPGAPRPPVGRAS